MERKYKPENKTYEPNIPLTEDMFKGTGSLNGIRCLVNKKLALVFKDYERSDAIIIDFVEGERMAIRQYSFAEPGKLHWGMGDAAMQVFVIADETLETGDNDKWERMMSKTS
tara:strand:- start:180 stop:515 length:336 start_codon:yes stop_codon:yes gene_type:complete